MKIELNASRVDVNTGGSVQTIAISCDKDEYEEALKLLEKFASDK